MSNKPYVRALTPLEFEELCDLFAKCGESDLLDFMYYIKEEARKYRYSENLMKEILTLGANHAIPK